jgi:hypothetical protein
VLKLVVTSCGLVGRYQRFWRTYCLHIRGWCPSMSTRHYNPDDQHQHLHRRMNLKSRDTSVFHFFIFTCDVWVVHSDKCCLRMPRETEKKTLWGQQISVESGEWAVLWPIVVVHRMATAVTGPHSPKDFHVWGLHEKRGVWTQSKQKRGTTSSNFRCCKTQEWPQCLRKVQIIEFQVSIAP